MTLSILSLVTILCVAMVGAGILWCRKMRKPTGRQHSKEMITPLISFSRARPSLELGMEHARRLEYKLAIIVLMEQGSANSEIAAANDDYDDSGSREGNGDTKTSVVDVLHNTPVLRETLRMTDIVAYDEDRQFVVIMLPGADNAHAAHTTHRIRKQLHLEHSNDVQTGCAEFPGDGLLLDDLILCASSRMGQEDVVRIHPGTQLNATK